MFLVLLVKMFCSRPFEGLTRLSALLLFFRVCSLLEPATVIYFLYFRICHLFLQEAKIRNQRC